MCNLSTARIDFCLQDIRDAKQASLTEREIREIETAETMIRENIFLPRELKNKMRILADKKIEQEKL